MFVYYRLRFLPEPFGGIKAQSLKLLNKLHISFIVFALFLQSWAHIAKLNSDIHIWQETENPVFFCHSQTPHWGTGEHLEAVSHISMLCNNLCNWGVWTLSFSGHKFLWQTQEPGCEELPSRSRKPEIHSRVTPHPWPSIFHKHGCWISFSYIHFCSNFYSDYQ